MKKRVAFLLGLLLSCALVAFGGPADGTWTAVNSAQGVPQIITMQTSGESLTGSADGSPILNGKISGVSLWFSISRSGVVYNYKGTISGTRLDLHETKADGSGHRALQFNHN
ncbi:MAG TPA: hypothetical protein VMH28_29195 [Candidatus Acidoferrales bacterium]|nr:hypothetical protein [Candidatus Acidoferrales bacterium]